MYERFAYLCCAKLVSLCTSLKIIGFLCLGLPALGLLRKAKRDGKCMNDEEVDEYASSCSLHKLENLSLRGRELTWPEKKTPAWVS